MRTNDLAKRGEEGEVEEREKSSQTLVRGKCILVGGGPADLIDNSQSADGDAALSHFA